MLVVNKQVFVFVCMVMVAVVCLAEEKDPHQHACIEHDINIDINKLQKRIRRHNELNVFDRWRFVGMDIERCVSGDTVGAELILAVPKSWSSHRIPYRLFIKLLLHKNTGKPKDLSKKQMRLLSIGVRRLILKAEADEEVKRFMKRFSIYKVEIKTAVDPTSPQATFWGRSQAGAKNDQRPLLVFSDKVEAGIIGYALPRMDSLPVRRELLRCMELLSLHHPGCIPIWIHARLNTSPSDSQDAHWKFDIQLTGKECPQTFQSTIFRNGHVIFNTESKTKDLNN